MMMMTVSVMAMLLRGAFRRGRWWKHEGCMPLHTPLFCWNSGGSREGALVQALTQTLSLSLMQTRVRTREPTLMLMLILTLTALQP